ncbi:MAG: VOC family protein [Polyangiaceae bacterium]|jgi:catechol 2,3-dioxygenase-like lactoylglutathione lyase family enzyme
MFSSKVTISISAQDTAEAVVFYEALLGTGPARRDSVAATFDVSSPALLLTIEQVPPLEPVRAGSAPRKLARRAPAERFILCVREPQRVGEVAIALRRAGIRLRLEDRGVKAHDPDGNTWEVRFSPDLKDCLAVVLAGRDTP